jgi:hypothetical protein
MRGRRLAGTPEYVRPFVASRRHRHPDRGREFTFQSAVDKDGKLAGRSRSRLGFASTSGKSPIERAERCVPAPERHRGHAQDHGGTIGGWLRPRAEQTASGPRPPTG